MSEFSNAKHMKKFLLVPVSLLFMFFCCNKENTTDLPYCIKEKIEEIKNERRWNPPAEIHEYIYNGQTGYLVIAGCCDQFNIFIDKNCNYICAPDGGITGKGDGKCADFHQKAQHVRLVWKDTR